MDDGPDQAGPSVIADEALSGSKAGVAAIGLACLRWTKAAAEHSRGATLKRYGPPAALTAGLFGLACLGGPISNVPRRPCRGPRSIFRRRKQPRNPTPKGRKSRQCTPLKA